MRELVVRIQFDEDNRDAEYDISRALEKLADHIHEGGLGTLNMVMPLRNINGNRIGYAHHLEVNTTPGEEAIANAKKALDDLIQHEESMGIYRAPVDGNNPPRECINPCGTQIHRDDGGHWRHVNGLYDCGLPATKSSPHGFCAHPKGE